MREMSAAVVVPQAVVHEQMQYAPEVEALLQLHQVPMRQHPITRRLPHKLLLVAGLLAAGLLTVGLLVLARLRHPASAAQANKNLEQILTEEVECSATHENCNATRCCKVPGTQCYMKADRMWALCRPSCHPGPDPTDIDDTPWTCKTLGERAPGHFKAPLNIMRAAPWVAKQCVEPGTNCNETRCCSQPGTACYRKNAAWASCKAGCIPGPDPSDADGNPWDCEQLGMRTPGIPPWPSAPAKWVAKACASDGEDCSELRCCVGAGMQCFKKNEHAAKCLVGCHPGVHMDDDNDHPWNCTPLGGRTPGKAAIAVRGPGKWVKENCSKTGTENCLHTRCCKEEGMQCYRNDDKWAGCLPSCTQWKKMEVNGELVNEKTNKSWSCEKLGTRTPRAWGTPSLFCFSVFRLYHEEANLMRNQLSKGIGIFSCDNYATFCADRGASLGDGPLGPLKTVHFQPAPVGRSKDGTAGNTALFMNVWEAVKWDGRYQTADWTIKADPDAVVIASRLRQKLKVHTGHPSFILTCGKAGMPDGPMMFGSVEAISTQALHAYFNSESTCRSLPWQSWGEDLWMGNCLKSLGVSAVGDFGMVSDGVCLYANCGDPNAAAFHPFKTVRNWMSCYWGAVR
mmetsp:Transcript_28739/g.89678  ORF Transcript_28739/g.89678 Transcript_28739/m.89678 type:complete len:625 (+) Transcript_28739:82-1956(+)